MITAALLLSMALAQPAEAREMERVARWRDGDTAVLTTGEVIRVLNIDAPELHPCRCASECALGEQARQWVLLRTENGARIERRGIDRYRRTLATVRTPDGADLGEELIARGLARRWTGRREPWCPTGRGELRASDALFG